MGMGMGMGLSFSAGTGGAPVKQRSRNTVAFLSVGAAKKNLSREIGKTIVLAGKEERLSASWQGTYCYPLRACCLQPWTGFAITIISKWAGSGDG